MIQESVEEKLKFLLIYQNDYDNKYQVPFLFAFLLFKKNAIMIIFSGTELRCKGDLAKL